jgi:hypothetical protein
VVVLFNCESAELRIVFINTSISSTGLFNWPIPHLIDPLNVFRILLFNWIISMVFIIRFKGSSGLTDRYVPALDQPSIFLTFLVYHIIPSIFEYGRRFGEQELLIRLP